MVIIGKCTRCQQVVDLDSNRKVQGCPSCDKMIVVERAVENFEQYHTDAERRKADRILEIHRNFLIRDGSLIKYKGTSPDVQIPDIVNVIGCSAFSHSSITSVAIPNGVTRIASGAFLSCKQLSHVTLPDSVLSIEADAFRGCESLVSISLSNNLKCIERYAFASCKSLNEIILPDTVTELGQGAFNNCPSLTHITLSKRLTVISSTTFNFCNSLTSIEIPPSVKEIKNVAFEHCYSLKRVMLSEGLVKIGEGVFRGCHLLNDIIIPASTVEIGNRAFAGCKKLSKVKFSGQKPQMGVDPFINTPYASRCYVATCVYGSYNCPEVWTLRRFRDSYLLKSWGGRLFVRLYYIFSPFIVKWFGGTSLFKTIWRKWLDKMVARLNANGYASTPYEDKV